MAGDPVELADDDPDVLGPPRDLDVEELLEGHDRRPLAEDRGQVVEGIHVRDRLVVVGVLAELLDAPVEVAQDRVQVHDLFPVDLEDDPQDAMRCRVVRPHVEEHLAIAEGVELPLSLGMGDGERLEDAGVVDRDLERRVVEAGSHRCRHVALAYAPGDVRRSVVSSASCGGPARSIGRSPPPGERATSSARWKSLRNGKLTKSSGR